MLAAVFFVFAIFLLMFAFPDYIPHFLIIVYFYLPIAYKYLNVQSLPLTAVFIVLFGPIILFHSSRNTIGFFMPMAIFLFFVFLSNIMNGVDVLTEKSFFFYNPDSSNDVFNILRKF